MNAVAAKKNNTYVLGVSGGMGNEFEQRRMERNF